MLAHCLQPHYFWIIYCSSFSHFFLDVLFHSNFFGLAYIMLLAFLSS